MAGHRVPPRPVAPGRGDRGHPGRGRPVHRHRRCTGHPAPGQPGPGRELSGQRRPGPGAALPGRRSGDSLFPVVVTYRGQHDGRSPGRADVRGYCAAADSRPDDRPAPRSGRDVPGRVRGGHHAAEGHRGDRPGGGWHRPDRGFLPGRRRLRLPRAAGRGHRRVHRRPPGRLVGGWDRRAGRGWRAGRCRRAGPAGLAPDRPPGPGSARRGQPAGAGPGQRAPNPAPAEHPAVADSRRPDRPARRPALPPARRRAPVSPGPPGRQAPEDRTRGGGASADGLSAHRRHGAAGTGAGPRALVTAGRESPAEVDRVLSASGGPALHAREKNKW